MCNSGTDGNCTDNGDNADYMIDKNVNARGHGVNLFRYFYWELHPLFGQAWIGLDMFGICLDMFGICL